MKKIILPLASFVTIFTVACNNNGTPKDSVDSAKKENKMLDSTKIISNDKDSLQDDHDFMVNAASGGMLEVALGKIAEKNAASAQVKDFGKMMVMDHTKANDKLKALAMKKNIALPSVPGDDEQKKIDKLQKKTGKDFDKDYVDLMVDDHKDDIKEFTKEADNAKDSSIKSLATATIPMLQKHLHRIQTIDSLMKK